MTLKRIAQIFYYGYTVMLLGIGGSGILIARWELSSVFSVDLAAMGSMPSATLLNQYRFLKSSEFAFGLYCWLYRRRIWAGGEARVLFLIGIFAGCAARALSIALDGAPHWAFQVFLMLELICALLMTFQPWRPA
jgi:Domain of unknown function (DUF4345)